MAQTLISVQENIQRFIDEARKCAKADLGFASLLTIFPVILGISEAILNERLTIEKLRKKSVTTKNIMEVFTAKMPDKKSWIFHQSSGGTSDSEIIEKITQIRDGLAHQLSLPIDVKLINNNNDAQRLSTVEPNFYIISTVGFIDAVETTVETIIRENPDLIFDPHPRETWRDEQLIVSNLLGMKG